MNFGKSVAKILWLIQRQYQVQISLIIFWLNCCNSPLLTSEILFMKFYINIWIQTYKHQYSSYVVMILLPHWKPWFLQYLTLAAHFPVKCLLLPTVAQARAGLLKGTLKPLKQVYNPTKTALFPSPGVVWLHFLLPGENSWLQQTWKHPVFALAHPTRRAVQGVQESGSKSLAIDFAVKTFDCSLE